MAARGTVPIRAYKPKKEPIVEEDEDVKVVQKIQAESDPVVQKYMEFARLIQGRAKTRFRHFSDVWHDIPQGAKRTSDKEAHELFFAEPDVHQSKRVRTSPRAKNTARRRVSDASSPPSPPSSPSLPSLPGPPLFAAVVPPGPFPPMAAFAPGVAPSGFVRRRTPHAGPDAHRNRSFTHRAMGRMLDTSPATTSGKTAQAQSHDSSMRSIKDRFESDVWVVMDLILFEIRQIDNAYTKTLTLNDLVFNVDHRSMFCLWVSCMLDLNSIVGGEQWRRQEVPIFLNTMMKRARSYFEKLQV
jgi:hypothetical protein